MRDRKKLEPPHTADSVFFKNFFFSQRSKSVIWHHAQSLLKHRLLLGSGSKLIACIRINPYLLENVHVVPTGWHLRRLCEITSTVMLYGCFYPSGTLYQLCLERADAANGSDRSATGARIWYISLLFRNSKIFRLIVTQPIVHITENKFWIFFLSREGRCLSDPMSGKDASGFLEYYHAYDGSCRLGFEEVGFAKMQWTLRNITEAGYCDLAL